MTRIKHEKNNQYRKSKEFREDSWPPFFKKHNGRLLNKNKNSLSQSRQFDLFQNQIGKNIDEIASEILVGNYLPLISDLALITQELIVVENRNSYESLKNIFEEKLKNIELSDFFLKDNKLRAERKVFEYKEVITYLEKLDVIIKSI